MADEWMRDMIKTLETLPGHPSDFPYWDQDVTYNAGAAVAFGLTGMALAIKENHDPWYRCSVCGSHSINSGGRCLSSTCDPDLRDRSPARE